MVYINYSEYEQNVKFSLNKKTVNGKFTTAMHRRKVHENRNVLDWRLHRFVCCKR